MREEFMGYRLSYVCQKNGRIKTISGYFEEDLMYLIEDASRDSTFVAIVKEAIYKNGTNWIFKTDCTLHGWLPENFNLTNNGYEELLNQNPLLSLYVEPE